MNDTTSSAPASCVVLVPTYRYIEPACDLALRALEERGYVVRRLYNVSAIDRARSLMATQAFQDGFAETLWVDSDIVFNPDDVEKLRAHQLPIVAGIYPKKDKRELAIEFDPDTKGLLFGPGGGLHEVLSAAPGFLHVRREVYQRVIEHHQLPLCAPESEKQVYPFFLPMIRNTEHGPQYLCEDWAFCQRVREAGFSIMTDTRVRLFHIGSYEYGWEDAGRARPRYESFSLDFVQKQKKQGLLAPIKAIKRLAKK